ncbi:MAG: CBS domain-containing protein [Anaerolineaceae bacterium]|nr:CBS domain-containing protein [Anaerolineaceae bacterium]NTV37514.1 CBS domain-containing protein [Anaerolineaceae bacterium]
MLVKERMSHPVLTIAADVPVQDALVQMHKDKVRSYPVVDKHGKIIGIVVDTDLMNATPSAATTLSVWEINSLMAKITVERVMTHKVFTVEEEATIEEAARIMIDAKIRSLPVMRDEHLVGMITETDLFGIFLEMLGARTSGVRVTLEVVDQPGKLFELVGAIHKLNGNITGMGAILGESAETSNVTLKVSGVETEALEKALTPMVVKILDIRTEKAS